jgi:hypothetical protein
VTLTIPSENIDDFRVGVIADLNIEAGGFGEQHASMLAAIERDDARWASTGRLDRDRRVKAIHETHELIGQLPDDDVEATMSGTCEAFRSAMDETARHLVERLKRAVHYAPVPEDLVLALLDRLRWTVEQMATIEREVGVMAADPVEWDARAELSIGVLIERYLHENPPPADARVAGDLADWGRRLRGHGEQRLRAISARPLRERISRRWSKALSDEGGER